MRIVIDMQGAQSDASRARGVGRYSLSLAKALAAQRGPHEIFLALSGLFPESIDPIRSTFHSILPRSNIQVWDAPCPVGHIAEANGWRRRTAELVREAFLARLNPDVVLLTSIFEGLHDDSVTSVGLLSRAWPTAAILYDLIPLTNRDPYLLAPAVEEWYENKLDHLRRTDLLLAISQASRQDAIDYLAFPSDSIVNISCAADSHFSDSRLDHGAEATVRERYRLHRPFVLYTGGIDFRKNIEGLIRAYASLPRRIRLAHQLCVVCSIDENARAALETLARAHGLGADELILTGHVSEEDLLALYRLCKVFAFPSLQEGFGLPVLEAMSCGRAVIASNTSSLPEVVGRADALFDPHDDRAIAEKLEHVLTDDDFRAELEKHGLRQAETFSWEATARRATAALVTLHARFVGNRPAVHYPVCRPRLAYVSPLPPEPTGIGDYSAELLPNLSRHYEITVIIEQDSVSDPWVRANCQIRSVDWFRSNGFRFERVLYHFGNSAFHQHMFGLLDQFPGVVVLHDFFLSGVAAFMEGTGYAPRFWTKELYRSHGYTAVAQRFRFAESADPIWRYPCNLSVLNRSRGVIVHSEYARHTANSWYGEESAADWAVIPLLRTPAAPMNRNTVRETLGIGRDDFVVCSFGVMGPTKLNHRLLQAWSASELSRDVRSCLVFVGEDSEGDYFADIQRTLQASRAADRISVTGRVDSSRFRQYLAAADVAVQLRTLSRGETSAAVLDCMNYGLPTIVNANGSMAELPDDACCMLADQFDDTDLTNALNGLWLNPTRRRQIGARAQEVVRTRHSPRSCADLYSDAIEAAYERGSADSVALAGAIAQIEPQETDDQSLLQLATSVARSIPPRVRQRQLLIDISELVQRDAGSGIQRVVRSILREWLEGSAAGFRVEPVYADVGQGYRYARRFTADFLGCPSDILDDCTVDFASGDVFFGLDFQPHVVPEHKKFFLEMQRQGVTVLFAVYDLLCVTHPQYFFDGAADDFNRWLETVFDCDGAICISQTVSNELAKWQRRFPCAVGKHFKIDWFHLGADIDHPVPPVRESPEEAALLATLRTRPTFLVVGTLEPRKAHAQVLEACDMLWQGGADINLVFVGKEGWMMEDFTCRLRQHPQLGTRLFWLNGIRDDLLKGVYASSAALISASYAEGFGLPLIEAARHRLPVIARDIPVSREVAGENAFYFSGSSAEALAGPLSEWLCLREKGSAPGSEDMRWLTWTESAQKLLTVILANSESTRTASPSESPRKPLLGSSCTSTV